MADWRDERRRGSPVDFIRDRTVGVAAGPPPCAVCYRGWMEIHIRTKSNAVHAASGAGLLVSIEGSCLMVTVHPARDSFRVDLKEISEVHRHGRMVPMDDLIEG